MATLADLAKKAWAKQPAEVKSEFQALAAEELNDPLISDAKVYDFWRRNWQTKVVGKSSMADMSNRHYLRMKSLWEELGGQINTALRTMVHEYDEKLRQALHLLEEETKAGGLAWPGYPAAIARTQCCGRKISELNADEVMHLVFTIRNRAKAKRDKSSAWTPPASCDERPIVEPDEPPKDSPPHPDADESGNWW